MWRIGTYSALMPAPPRMSRASRAISIAARQLFHLASETCVGLESKGREPPPTRLEQLTASFATEDGRLRTEDLALVSDDFAIKGRGTVGHDQSVDLETKVRFTAQGLEKILVLARVPRVGVRKHRFPPVSVNVAGTLMEPSFSPAAPRILAASFGALAWGAQEAGDAAGRAVGAVLDAAGVADAAEPEEDGHESGDDPDPSSQ